MFGNAKCSDACVGDMNSGVLTGVCRLGKENLLCI